MPRLAPSLLRRARAQHALLPSLLRECRDLRSTQNELRWLKEHSIDEAAKARVEGLRDLPGWRSSLRNYVKRRSRGEPLQYILGSQPFGDLDIVCRPGVLTPRPETETYTIRLAELLESFIASKQGRDIKELRILDLCTGSGCIALLLHSLLRPLRQRRGPSSGCLLDLRLKVLGIDISTIALDLAHDNLEHNIRTGNLHALARSEVSFKRADVTGGCFNKSRDLNGWSAEANVQRLKDAIRHHHGLHYDVLVANPPYISPKHFAPGGTTSSSVRKWEPELALVPQQKTLPAHGKHCLDQHLAEPSLALERGDEFYPTLFDIAITVDANVVVVEVGDADQAARIASLAREMFSGNLIEIWRDNGSIAAVVPGYTQDIQELAHDGRAVVVWRNTWARWRASREEGNGELYATS